MTCSNHRVVLMTGNQAHHRYTQSRFLSSGINIVGVFECERTSFGIPLKYIKISLKTNGFLATLSQVIARLIYRLRNSKRDKAIYQELFDDKVSKETINSWSGNINSVDNFIDDQLVSIITKLRPSILVVHTGCWVGKAIREMPNVNYVIGGHPGITPLYRGVHSPFWAIYNKEPSLVGWSVFELDSGVDTGPVYAQGQTLISTNETFFTLSWKGMKNIVDAQIELIKKIDAGEIVKPISHDSIPDKSNYGQPGLFQLLKYWYSQKSVK